MTIKEAIDKLADKAKDAKQACDALHFSQAALNLANTKAQLKHSDS